MFDQIIGPLTVDELLSRLMTVLEENDAVLVAERAELQERSRNRVLLQQQGEHQYPVWSLFSLSVSQI